MEDQGVLNHQTFLVKTFPFYRRENKTIGVLSREFWTDHRFKAASCTFVLKKNDNVQHYFEDEFDFWNHW